MKGVMSLMRPFYSYKFAGKYTHKVGDALHGHNQLSRSEVLHKLSRSEILFSDWAQAKRDTKSNCKMNLKLVSAFLLLVGDTLHLCSATSNMTYTDDVVRVRTRREGRRDASSAIRSLTVDPTDRQANVWNTINSMESYKTNTKLFSSTRWVAIILDV